MASEGHASTWIEQIPGFRELQHWAEEALQVEWLEQLLRKYAPFATDGRVDILPVALSTLVVLLLALLGGVAFRKLHDTEEAIVPEARLSVRTLVEIVAEATYGAMVDMMGRDAARHFLPLIGTCAMLILTSNVLGLVPGMAAPTSNLNMTFAAGLVIFAATHFYGVKEHGLGPYLRHFLGPVGFWWPEGGAGRKLGALLVNVGVLALMGLMGIIEGVAHVFRPITLGVRLAANMTADHTVLGIFSNFGWISPLAVSLVYLLGFIVVIVQTVVFCLLSIVYISLAIAHEEH